MSVLLKNFNSVSPVSTPIPTEEVFEFLDALDEDMVDVDLIVTAYENASRFGSGEEDVLQTIAACPSTPSWIVEALSKHECHFIRHGAAINPMAPVEALRVLLNDESHIVRAWAKRHPAIQKAG